MLQNTCISFRIFVFPLDENMSSPHTPPDLAELLKQLPTDAKEPTVCANFITHFLEYLGFNPLTDIVQGFSTGNGANSVDYALRKSDSTSLSFLSTALSQPQNSLPEMILEAKGRATKSQTGSNFINLSALLSIVGKWYNRDTVNRR